jgi:hypothetical protein
MLGVPTRSGALVVPTLAPQLTVKLTEPVMLPIAAEIVAEPDVTGAVKTAHAYPLAVPTWLADRLPTVVLRAIPVPSVTLFPALSLATSVTSVVPPQEIVVLSVETVSWLGAEGVPDTATGVLQSPDV